MAYRASLALKLVVPSDAREVAEQDGLCGLRGCLAGLGPLCDGGRSLARARCVVLGLWCSGHFLVLLRARMKSLRKVRPIRRVVMGHVIRVA